MNFRIKIIQYLIELNEQLIFYPKLKKYYASKIQSKKPIVLDIGSNKGQFIDFTLSLFPNAIVYGFEPNPSLFKKLQLKYIKNNSIKIFNIGVSDINGELKFNENVMDETSSFEGLNYDSEYLTKKAKILGVEPSNIIRKSYNVPVVKLTDWIIKENLKNIDLIKIDTEGHEIHCLNGLFDTRIDCKIEYIQIESHSDDMYSEKDKNKEIPFILKKNGFEEITKIKHGFGDFYEIIYKGNSDEA
jgi:FkbM family methyltransferase